MRWSKSPCEASSFSAVSRRLSIASAESVPRPARRSRRTAGSGGAMKIWIESGFAARTCWAPWTSISSTTEWPASSRRSTSERSVP